MSDTAPRRATRAELEALPRAVVGELIGGVLYTFPRPRARHQNAGTETSAVLRDPYQHGRGGPGGWWILNEPGIELRELDVEEIAPDVAGWGRERLPTLPDGSIALAPDWACEILSPSTRAQRSAHQATLIHTGWSAVAVVHRCRRADVDRQSVGGGPVARAGRLGRRRRRAHRAIHRHRAPRHRFVGSLRPPRCVS
jgi:Putative restriction endonuclease